MQQRLASRVPLIVNDRENQNRPVFHERGSCQTPVLLQQASSNAMFSLFRRKIKHASDRGSLKKSAPSQADPGRSDPPTFEGYTIDEVDPHQLADSIQAAHLTPEQLVRWENVLGDKDS